MKNTITLNNLIKSLIETLDDNAGEILTSTFSEDLLRDYADSEVHIYNDDILDLCKNEPWLGNIKPDIEASNAFDFVRFNIYDCLIERAYEWLHEKRLN